MGFDASAPTCPVTVVVNEDLIRCVRQRTSNLSDTVEGLLRAFLTEANAKDLELRHRIDAHIAASDAFVAKYGLLADEFNTL